MLPTKRVPSVHAATIGVNTTSDELTVDGNCSLREAIQAVNTQTAVDGCTAGTGGDDTILVPAGIYTLAIPPSGPDDNTTGGLDINEYGAAQALHVTVQGAGAASTIIQGCDDSIGPCTGVDTILTAHHPKVTVSGVTVRKGLAGIVNLYSLTVEHSVITDNDRGGIRSVGNTAYELVVSDSAVTNNVSSDNYGGGILASYQYAGGTVAISKSTVSGNIGAYGGGGIAFWSAGELTIQDTTISGNLATQGGGGGVLSIQGPMRISNSTISGNSALYGNGAGIDNSGGLATISSTTISGNIEGDYDYVGAGVYTGGSRTTILKNSIVAGNLSIQCGGDGVTSLGHNMSSDASCSFTNTGDLNNTDPMLGPLADNGGVRATQALRDGSPALDAIPVAECTDGLGQPVSSDERGTTRPQGGACDIGAYEAGPAPPDNDSDGDGCSDRKELGADHHLGGQRDPNNALDFYDVPVLALSLSPIGVRNHGVGMTTDVIALLHYVGLTSRDRDYVADYDTNGVPDGLQYDRSLSTTPGEPWRSGPWDGGIGVTTDVVAMLAQAGDTCT